MTVSVPAWEIIDTEHESALRITPDRCGLTIEAEDWSGPDRRWTRVVLDPADCDRLARQIRRLGREAKALREEGDR